MAGSGWSAIFFVVLNEGLYELSPRHVGSTCPHGPSPLEHKSRGPLAWGFFARLGLLKPRDRSRLSPSERGVGDFIADRACRRGTENKKQAPRGSSLTWDFLLVASARRKRVCGGNYLREAPSSRG